MCRFHGIEEKLKKNSLWDKLLYYYILSGPTEYFTFYINDIACVWPKETINHQWFFKTSTNNIIKDSFKVGTRN